MLSVSSLLLEQNLSAQVNDDASVSIQTDVQYNIGTVKSTGSEVDLA